METNSHHVQHQTPQAAPTRSWLRIVVLILALAVLIGGTYFAYLHFYTNGGSSTEALFPEEFEKYAVGADADGFIAVRNDERISAFLTSLELPIEGDYFQNALLLMKKNDSEEAMTAVVQFKNPEYAKDAEKWLSEQPNYFFSDSKIKVEENVLIVSKGDGLEDFQGSLYENPLLKNLDDSLLNSQFILHVDNKAIPEMSISSVLLQQMKFLTPTPFGSVKNNRIIPAANAAGLLKSSDSVSSIKEATGSSSRNNMMAALRGLAVLPEKSGLFLELNETSLRLSLTNSLMDKAEFSKNFKFASDFEEAGKLYEEVISSLKSVVPQLEEQLKTLPFSKEGGSVEVVLDVPQFSVTLDVPTKAFQELVVEQKRKMEKASIKARDVQRQAHIHRLKAIIITYNLETGSTFNESSCVEDLDGLDVYYVQMLEEPSDPSGEQTFGDETCKSGYYYQFVDGKGFILWAKVEDEENGNFDMSPEMIANGEGFPGKSDLGNMKNGKYVVVADLIQTDENSEADSATQFTKYKGGLLAPLDPEPRPVKVKKK